MTPSVLVIGASGSFGQPLMEEFLKDSYKGKFTKIGILSDPAKAGKFDHLKARGIEIISGSYFDPKPYNGFDTVISLAGNSIMRLQPAMIDSAIAGGVTHFYPSEYGADIAQDGLKHCRYFRDKFVTRDHLVMRSKEHPEFKYTLMLTGAFTEWINSPAYGVDSATKSARVYGNPDALMSTTSIPDAARYTVESVLLPFNSPSQKREIRVAGEYTSFRKVMQKFGEIEKTQYELILLPNKEAEEKEDEARKRGDEGEELKWSLVPLSGSGSAHVGKGLDNDKFSFRPETVEETVQRLYA